MINPRIHAWFLDKFHHVHATEKADLHETQGVNLDVTQGIAKRVECKLEGVDIQCVSEDLYM